MKRNLRKTLLYKYINNILPHHHLCEEVFVGGGIFQGGDYGSNKQNYSENSFCLFLSHNVI